MKVSQILYLLFIPLFFSCTSTPIEEFVVGDNFIRNTIGVVMIDTLILKSSVVKIDSISSNSSGRLLVGSNYNPFSGYKNSTTYIEMKFDDNITKTEFVFDSLKLELYYDTYSFGDTTISQTFNVYQLNEEMELNDNSYLYTTSSFAYEDQLLGSMQIKPKPHSHKKESIRLSDALGLRLAQMIKVKNDTLFYQSLFKKFFKGLVIGSPQYQQAAAVGFRISKSTTSVSTSTDEASDEVETMPEMRLYYHLSSNPDDLKGLYYKFSFYSDGIYFNQITEDTSNSLLEHIADSDNEQSTSTTNNQLFVQSGIQVFSKIKIPAVDNLLSMGDGSAFVGATLRLFPVKGTYSKITDLPDSLYLFSADRKNQITAQILMPGSTTVYSYARLRVERDVEILVYYEVDLGNFVDTELKDVTQTNASLLIGYGKSSIKKTLDHVVLGGVNSGKYSPELKVYYYHN
jgi:hypothetical protein